MNIQRGFRDKMEKYADPNQELCVEMQVGGNAVYDYCCFGVDAAGKLSDDRYMVFYNQVHSPQQEITYVNDGGSISVCHNCRLPFRNWCLRSVLTVTARWDRSHPIPCVF